VARQLLRGDRRRSSAADFIEKTEGAQIIFI
jgi:hypothetical protein